MAQARLWPVRCFYVNQPGCRRLDIPRQIRYG